MKKRPIVAIMYDFDKTLCSEDMQNYRFIPDLEMTAEDFWQETSNFGEKENMEKILAYMYMMVQKAKERGIIFNDQYLHSLGKTIVYYKGVESWFARINNYAEDFGLEVEHYIISSGIKAIIEGSSIARKFKQIYACEYVYDQYGQAIWPKVAINYTMKTQFIFRISKGVDSINDDDIVNQRISENKRKVLYRNMIYIGDGITDVPCMRLLKDKGGKSIAVYPKKEENKVLPLLRDGRVNFVCEADYSVNSQLDKIIKMQIEHISLQMRMEDISQKQLLKVNKEN